MKDFTAEAAREHSSKLIQDLLSDIKYQSKEEIGQALGTLMMLTTRCLDGVMGPDYASATIIAVAEQMASGEPQKKTVVEVIDRSKLN